VTSLRNFRVCRRVDQTEALDERTGAVRVGLGLAILGLAVLAPAAAEAASLQVTDGVLRYKGGAGEVNEVGIQQVADGSYELYDNSAIGQFGGTTVVTFGAGCGKGGELGMRCDGTGVTAVRIKLGDKDDRLCEIVPLAAPLSYSGGSGRDSFYYCGVNGPVARLSNDNAANDGPNGVDDIRQDVETLGGGPKNDTLASGPGGATLRLNDGEDTALGGSGDDRIEAAFVVDVGEDSGAFLAQGTDTVSCGGGQDFVLADKQDSVASDCEAVGRPKGEGSFKFVGSSGPDFMVIPYGWSPARIYGRGGADRIQTSIAGESRVEGGDGNDRLRSADEARDDVRGNAGRDTIYVRDTNPRTGNEDKVKCGAGRDTVYADSKDKIARDCEKVKRKG
jgi:Ca2+-binding RTX toxin-like protein